MSLPNAPLYVEAHDLARWLLERLEGWHESRGQTLRQPISDAACQLVTAVSLALTFPGHRAEHVRRADETVVGLRMLLRLASELGLLSPRQLRHAQSRLRTIGRMLGGWQKRLRPKEDTPTQPLRPQFQGTGSPAPAA